MNSPKTPSWIVGGKWICLLPLFLLSGVVEAEEIRNVALTVGHGWAMVREVRRVDLSLGAREVLFDKIPREADLSFFIVRSLRTPLDLKSWEWAEDGLGRQGSEGNADRSLTREGSAVRWAPGRQELGVVAEGTRSVKCVIDSLVAGERSVELIYLVRGLDWHAHYKVVVRGWGNTMDEKVGVGLRGSVDIENRTSRDFVNAKCRLVGEDTSHKRGKNPEPGFLMLDEISPLADLWRFQPPEEGTEFTYAIPRSVNLHSQTKTSVALVHAARVRASRLYVMNSDSISITSEESGNPLEQYIVFKNTAEEGLGLTLPSGPVDIFPGGIHRHRVSGASVPHTAVSEEIRIAMGAALDVLGRRHYMGRSRNDGDSYESVYEIVVQNNRPVPVHIEISERPPLAFKWDIVTVDAPCVRRTNRLRLDVELAGMSKRRIQYRIRVQQPRL